MRVVTRGGVPVYTDYKENIIVDSDHPILAWKAAKDRLRPSTTTLSHDESMCWRITLPHQGQIPVQRASIRWSSRRVLGRDQRGPEVFFDVQAL